MVIAVASTKGGVGKSTLSMHFLHALTLRDASKKLMLFDADHQATCLNWSRWRAEAGLPLLEVQPLSSTGMRAILDKKRKEYDTILIDVGGTDNVNLRTSLFLVDVVVVPISLDPAERHHTFDTMKLIHEAREFNPGLVCFVVLNKIRPTKERGAMGAFREGFPPYVKWIEQFVSQRVILSRVYSAGKSVFDVELEAKGTSAQDEAKSAGKARADIEGVLDEISEKLGADDER